MPWTDAFAPVEAENRQAVLRSTWGHLAPKENKAYHGVIQFAVGIFGHDHLNPTAIKCELKSRDGEELDSSPWFYEHLNDFLHSMVASRFSQDDAIAESGNVYEWRGTFRNYRFRGHVRQLKLI